MAKLILQTELLQHSSTVKHGLSDMTITQSLSGNINFMFLTVCSEQY
jgi:hypothetical protein